jgi:hypothetical protein
MLAPHVATNSPTASGVDGAGILLGNAEQQKLCHATKIKTDTSRDGSWPRQGSPPLALDKRPYRYARRLAATGWQAMSE